MNRELCYLPAIDIIRKFMDGSLSPVALMQAIIDRAGEVEPVTNALCLTDFDAALDQAREAEKRYRAGIARPLEGVPVAVKDEAAIAGRITTNGSLLLKDNRERATDPVPQRLLDAGAIVHARTTTPEFSMEFFTWSKIWGVTRNPWNPAITPGGSSGGSGAALASGTTTLATGTDIGGSIRVPAAMNGIVGYKPPYGRVPQSGIWALDVYCHEGPMARTVSDCILMQNVIAGPHPSDMTSLSPKLELPFDFEDLAGLRIAVSPDLGFFNVHDDGKRNLQAVAGTLSDLGAALETVELNWDERCRDTANTHFRHLCGAIYRRDYGNPEVQEQLTSYIRKFIEISDPVTSDEIVAAREHTIEMYWELARVFESFDVMLCPTLATTDIPADFRMTKERAGSDISFDYSTALDLYLTYPFNTLSRCPVLNVPTGFSGNGVPTGMQIVAKPYDDPTVFRVGKALENTMPFFRDDCFPDPTDRNRSRQA